MKIGVGLLDDYKKDESKLYYRLKKIIEKNIFSEEFSNYSYYFSMNSKKDKISTENFQV